MSSVEYANDANRIAHYAENPYKLGSYSTASQAGRLLSHTSTSQAAS